MTFFGNLPPIQIIAHLVTVFGLAVIIIQLYINYMQEKRQRAYHMSDRYWDNYSTSVHKARMFLLTPEIWSETEEESRWNQFEYPILDEDQELRRDILLVFGFFEELGLLWNMGLIDKNVVRRLLRGVILHQYRISLWILVRIKDKYGSSAYIEWKTMVKHLNEPSTLNFKEWLEYQMGITSE